VLGVYARVLLDVYARGARERGIERGQTGMVTALQRAGGALNANLQHRRALIGFSMARRTPSCLRGEALSVLIRPARLPVDGGGVPAQDAAQPGGRGRRARRLPMCAVASGSWAASVRVWQIMSG
jgi:hypothetical protein